MTEDDAGPQEKTGFRVAAAELVLAAVLLAILSLYAARFVASEHTLYRADQLAYWTYSSRLAEHLRDDPWSAVQSVAWSVAHADLNLLPAVPIATAMLLVGDSRTAYILSVINLYGLAVVIALLVAVRRLVPNGPTPRSMAVPVAAAGALLLLPTLWRPVFIGYLGLGGVALGIVILAVYLHGEGADQGWKPLLLLGFLIALLALFRRWYALWSMAFCVVVAVDVGWRVVRDRSFDRRSILAAARTPLIVALTAIATLVVLAGPVTVQRVAPEYGEEFAAYARHGTLGGRLSEVVGEFGLLPLALVVAAAFLLGRRPRMRRVAVLLPLHMVVTWAFMVRLQDHSPHHWYLYLAAALLLLSSALVTEIGAIPRRLPRIGAAAAVVVVGLVVSAGVYLPTFQPVADAATPLVSRNRVRPQQRGDLDEVSRLLQYLDDRTAHRPGYIYVLGNTRTLSEQTLAFANRSLGTDFRSTALFLQTSHLDLRDGFPRGLLEAAYVLVPQPAQVIVIPTDSFIAGANIAKAFHRLPEEFLLERGVRVLVFERHRPNHPSEVAELSELLHRAYPDRPDIYGP
jgi:hypothetical protein